MDRFLNIIFGMIIGVMILLCIVFSAIVICGLAIALVLAIGAVVDNPTLGWIAVPFVIAMIIGGVAGYKGAV